MLPMILGGGGYSGASTIRRELREWFPLARSADFDTVPDLPTLRARSRDLERNSPIAGGAIGTCTTSVVGSGLRLQATIDREILGLTPEQASAWESLAERIFRHTVKRLDIRRRQTWPQMQDTAFTSQLGSGDVLGIRRYKKRAGDLLGLKLQMVEADRICTPPERSTDPRLIDGVEIDGDGAAVAYHIRNRHRDDWTLGATRRSPDEWSRVMALGTASRQRQTIHLAELKRPGQTRGVPFLAPIIELAKQSERLVEAEVAAAVVSSFLTIITKLEGGGGLADEVDTSSLTDTGRPDSPTRDFKMAPAAVLDLSPGETSELVNPLRPNALVEPFIDAMVTLMGMRLEIPQEVLTKRFKASYSAARGAIIEAWRFFRKRRAWFASEFCAPIYEWVITEAVMVGLLEAPGFFEDPIVREAWLGAMWVGDPQGHIDPTKEVSAYRDLREAGWISDGEAVQELRGVTHEEVIQRRGRDAIVVRAAGLDAVEPRPRGESEPPEPEPDPDLPEQEEAA